MKNLDFVRLFIFYGHCCKEIEEIMCSTGYASNFRIYVRKERGKEGKKRKHESKLAAHDSNWISCV